jgi:hypothetical protein
MDLEQLVRRACEGKRLRRVRNRFSNVGVHEPPAVDGAASIACRIRGARGYHLPKAP